MKKASVKFIGKSKPEMLAKFQPLYLFASLDPQLPKPIRIFINSSKESCYIQENEIWQEIIINHSLLGLQKETYYFQAKNRYHYLEIVHDDAYLALADSDRKIFFKKLGLSKEILQELAPPNLEQLNTSAIASTKIDAEKILKLTRRIAQMNTEIIGFKKILAVLTDARSAMERLNNDKNEKFTLADLDDQIKLFKRQKHYSENVKLTAQIKIQALLTIDKQEALEDYQRNLHELNLQKKEINRSLQDQQRAIAKLKRVAKCFAGLNSASSDVLVIEQIHSQIKLMDNNLQSNRSQLEKIEEEIKVLVKPEDYENAKVANKQIQSLFFNSVIKPNPIQCRDTGLNNCYAFDLV